MSARLAARIRHCKKEGRTAFVGFVTAGFPTQEHTVPILLKMEASGADIIELGIPFSDPLADGATIQRASVKALAGGITVKGCLELVRKARTAGLKVPIVFMGYVNPMLAYGFDKLAAETKEAGADGFIMVDLPGEASHEIVESLNKHRLSYIPLVTPATKSDRIARLAALATGFVYCVSVTGVTGQRAAVSASLPDFLARIRKHTDLPLMVGFGISKREHVVEIGKNADGVVVGSAFIAAAESAGDGALPDATAGKIGDLIATLVGGTVLAPTPKEEAKKLEADPSGFDKTKDEYSFGKFGGRYIPETLVAAHEELWAQYQACRDDPEYIAELARLRKDYVGGPTPIFHCKRLSAKLGGAQIWLKREDLAHTGAHKINNALGQALLAQKLGKKRIIAETGAGQHGVATATACALLGLECIVYMGAEDMRRQSLNVFRMQVLGAKCVPVHAGSKTLKDAINEAMRDWVTNVDTTHYIVGSAIGPHPFPTIVRDLQSVMGKEARKQFLETTGKLPDVAVACVGGGSNAIGMFHPFVGDKEVRLVGVEAGGATGLPGSKHSATLTYGTPGVLHGNLTYLLQDDDGQVSATHSVSAGLDYPGVGPEHAFLKDSGRAEYMCINDKEALDGFKALSEMEGIIPALETAHAVAQAMQLAAEMKPEQTIIINLSGRGDKDMIHVARVLGVELGI
eukprot:CAMPEP_0182916712 /NCGR_PEP_ID=MMETSP0105_2-20130417/1108_1 /TAXON_ID=81532 ORGANISM="Acanthoeca-like sp., Strain 10tr" /NCGR_SAMPLE_ID=MMETSP0105_2 /ASSEMBLY_ACC=CAM_ASM_000205 /LENGTH=686 /DNA_ID=CAMNT_0025053677 /DNA_START=36 /DNA_END=2096 /DNA_ORIENTATION=-